MRKLAIDLLQFCISGVFSCCFSIFLSPCPIYHTAKAITTVMFDVQPPDLADNKQSTVEEPAPPITGDRTVAITHPETDYFSVGALFRPSWRRFTRIWTRRFILSLLAGQIVSLCITCTSVATQELTSRNWALPTTQTFFLCAFLPPVNFSLMSLCTDIYHFS